MTKRGQGRSSKQTALWMLKYDVWLLCMSECCTDLFTYATLTHIYQRMLIFVWSLWNCDCLKLSQNHHSVECTWWCKNCDDTNTQQHFCVQSNTLVFGSVYGQTELQRTPVHEINAEVRSAILILTDSDCLHSAVTWEEARQTLTGRKFHSNVDLWPALSACRDTTRHVSQSSSLAACCTATRVCWGKGKQAHNCTCNLVWSCDKFQAIKKVAEEPKISKITNNNNNKKIRVLMAGFSFVLLC